MPNKIVTFGTSSEEAIVHYGVLGMKWGARRASRKTNSLDRKVSKTVRKYDKGKTVDSSEVSGLSRRVRKQRYKVERKMRNAQRFLDKADRASAQDVVNRYNRDPAKKAAVQDFLNSMKLNATTLSELRMQLIDIRV